MALAAMLIYTSMQETPQRLTQRDIDAAVMRALDALPPEPSMASQVYQVIYPSLVRIRAQLPEGEADPGVSGDNSAIGAGVIIDDMGTILTAHHVVMDAVEINMIVAVARLAAVITLPSQQGTVILAIDVSGSMRADDLKPNRLEATKEAARAFVESQPSNVRIGVVSFADSASVVQAPTDNRAAVIGAINRLSLQRRTAIGSGILTSLDAIFEDLSEPAPPPRDPLVLPPVDPGLDRVAPGSNQNALIVLMSDGVSNTGPLPLEAASRAADRGVRVYTVGVGSSEGVILRFESGQSVRVRLDEETLKMVAQRTDARYFRAGDETDLRAIYENLGRSLVFETEKTELTFIFTGAGVVLLLVSGILSLLWFNRML